MLSVLLTVSQGTRVKFEAQGFYGSQAELTLPPRMMDLVHTSFRHLPSSKLFFCMQSKVSVSQAHAGTSTTHFESHKLANDMVDLA